MSDSDDKKESVPSDFSEMADERQVGLFREFWDFLKYNKKWWLTPIIVVLLLVAVLVIIGNLYPAALPFIYTLH